MLLAIAIAPVDGMCYKTYLMADGRYASIEQYSNNYIELWNRYKPNYSHYTDWKVETFSGKDAFKQLTAYELQNCVSSIQLVQTASGPCAALSLIPYVGGALSTVCFVGFGANAVNQCYNAGATILVKWEK